MEAGGPGILFHPWLCHESEASLVYMRHYLKTRTRKGETAEGSRTEVGPLTSEILYPSNSAWPGGGGQAERGSILFY